MEPSPSAYRITSQKSSTTVDNSRERTSLEREEEDMNGEVFGLVPVHTSQQNVIQNIVLDLLP
jgi:hypothetical protein